CRGGGDNGRRKSSGCDTSKLGEGVDVIGRRTGERAVSDLMIDDKKPVRLSAGHPKFFLVYFSEELALVKFDGALEIAAKFRPGYIEKLHLHPAPRVEPTDEPPHAAPAAFEAAHALTVEDGIDLSPDQGVEGGYVAINCGAALFTVDSKLQ